MIGVVLCGGLSSRMGRDKGMIFEEGITWAGKAYSKLQSLGFNTIVSVNPNQVGEYIKFFPDKILVQDSVDVKGPLRGILSVHEKFPTSDLFVIACDMCDITSELLNSLYYQYYHNKEEFQFWSYRNENFYEPLCAVYSADGLSKILEAFNKGTLEKYSMQHVLEQGKTMSVAMEESQKHFFSNYNDPTQLKSAIEKL